MPPSGGFYVFHPWSLLGKGTIVGLRRDTISQGGQMQSYQCPFCKAQFSEEDKAWDTAIDSPRCPECLESLPDFRPSLQSQPVHRSALGSLGTQASAVVAALSRLPSVPQSEDKGGFNRQIQDLLVTAFGFVASAATALILLVIEKKFGIAIYSFTLWLVVPAGAMLSGFVAASGWHLGSILLNHRPTRLLLVNMGLASVTTFFTIYWLNYISTEIDGKLVSEYVSFSQYIDILLTRQQVESMFHGVKTGATGELGGFGYVVAALQIVGFALGAVGVFGYLSRLPSCEKCNKYLKSKAKQLRYADTRHELTGMALRLFTLFQNREFQKALDEHGAYGQSKLPKGGYLLSSIRRRQCPLCHVNHLKFSAKKLVGTDWKDLDELSFFSFYQGELHP